MTKPVLELVEISKHFGMTKALERMSLQLFAGEVHAIVGENGAGKSTMIKIMTGVFQPTSGVIKMDGNQVSLNGTKAARMQGVVAMYQEPLVFPDLDVAENIFIGAVNEGLFRRPSRQRKQARELVERIGMSLDVERIASGLTLAEQQAVEIARALSQDVRVLIMDEPTASLSAHEALRLRQIARKLASEGVAVVYISHRLEEIFEIADRVSTIRDGVHISTKAIQDVTRESLINDMVGREVGNYFAKAPSSKTNETILQVQDLALSGVYKGINFELHKGEVLCLSGLIGARRTDVALSLFGITPPTAGVILHKGAPVVISSPKAAMELKVAYVSEDRRKFGLAMSMDIRSNMTLATLKAYLSKLGLINFTREREVAEGYREALNIRTPNVDFEVGMLSGGNQQKVMLVKWLAMHPEILIFDEPTRGIDVGAKAEVHELIRKFASDGGAVIVISSDLPEVIALGDRVLVMREGQQMCILDHTEATSERIMAMATGADIKAAS